MSYFSAICDQLPVIDDSTPIASITSDEFGRGYEVGGYEAEGYGSNPYGKPFDLPLIPEDEWKERIEEKDRNETWCDQVARREGVETLNQGRTNYCWINGPVQCLQINRVQQGQDHVPLSPASGGAIIKNYRNVGGWGSQAITFIAENGLSPVDLWPANAIDRQYDNVESQRHRKRYKISEWLELRPRNMAQSITCALSNIPTAPAFNHWRHLVCGVRYAIDRRGQIVRVIWNSWGDNWGDSGLGILSGSKSYADEEWAPSIASLTD